MNIKDMQFSKYIVYICIILLLGYLGFAIYQDFKNNVKSSEDPDKDVYLKYEEWYEDVVLTDEYLNHLYEPDFSYSDTTEYLSQINKVKVKRVDLINNNNINKEDYITEVEKLLSIGDYITLDRDKYFPVCIIGPQHFKYKIYFISDYDLKETTLFIVNREERNVTTHNIDYMLENNIDYNKATITLKTLNKNNKTETRVIEFNERKTVDETEVNS